MWFCIQGCVLYFWHQLGGCAKDPIKGGRPEFLLPQHHSCKISSCFTLRNAEANFYPCRKCPIFPLFATFPMDAYMKSMTFCNSWNAYNRLPGHILSLASGLCSRLMVTFLEMMVAKMVYTLCSSFLQDIQRLPFFFFQMRISHKILDQRSQEMSSITKNLFRN